MKDGVKIREPSPELDRCMLSGLERMDWTKELGFINVGERCNISGSIKFKKLILNNDYDAALAVAKAQVENGAQVIDVNMDDGMLDGEYAMERFLRLCVTEPDISKVPFMIDSSKFTIIEKGLQQVQGRCIVNSISLKGGEEEFVRQAKIIRRYGAAVVVMAFDEQGQAAEVVDKVRICKRSFDILTQQCGLAPWDIIFDLNVLTIATGMVEHNSYAANFILACESITQECKGCHVSGGLSNLSFGFRGLNDLREAMHR
jgi:5-methyltetrahydrofolate--homocysteine methyltransferase